MIFRQHRALALSAMAAGVGLLCGCAPDYTVLLPAGARPAAIIEPPGDAAIDHLWFAAGGRRIVCAGSSLNSSSGNLVSVIDAPTGRAVHTCEDWPVGLSAGLLAVWRAPSTVAVYDVAAEKVPCLWTHEAPARGQSRQRLLPGGQFVQIGASVRDLRTGAEAAECEPGAVPTDDLDRCATLRSFREGGGAILEVALKRTADKEVEWTCPIKMPSLPVSTKAGFDAAGRILLVHAWWHRPPPAHYRGPSPAGAIRIEHRSWVIDAAEGEPILPAVVHARFTADRKALLAQKKGTQRLCLLSIPDGRELARFSGLCGVVSSGSGVVAGPTGVAVGSSPARRRIELLDSTTGRVLAAAKLPGGKPWDCQSLSPDGRFCLLRDGSGLERCVVAASTGDCVLHLRGEARGRSVFAFSFARRAAFAAGVGRLAVNVQKRLLVFDLPSPREPPAARE
jgi:hypothetical protein